MALRPLPLAAGALSSPEMSPTTLPRSPEPRFRHSLPASSSARPSARTGGGHAIEFTFLSASQCEEPLRLAEQSALERKAASSAPHASHVPYRCLCRAGAAGAAGERSSAGRAYAFVTGWRNCIGTCIPVRAARPRNEDNVLVLRTVSLPYFPTYLEARNRRVGKVSPLPCYPAPAPQLGP